MAKLKFLIKIFKFLIFRVILKISNLTKFYKIKDFISLYMNWLFLKDLYCLKRAKNTIKILVLFINNLICFLILDLLILNNI